MTGCGAFVYAFVSVSLFALLTSQNRERPKYALFRKTYTDATALDHCHKLSNLSPQPLTQLTQPFSLPRTPSLSLPCSHLQPMEQILHQRLHMILIRDLLPIRIQLTTLTHRIVMLVYRIRHLPHILKLGVLVQAL